jgi:hypothetical protein
MFAKIYFYCENEKSTMIYSAILGFFSAEIRNGKTLSIVNERSSNMALISFGTETYALGFSLLFFLFSYYECVLLQLH